MSSKQTSRKRFAEYRSGIKKHRDQQKRPIQSSSDDADSAVKPRTFGQLFWHFLQLLRGQRLAIGFALATLTLATLLKLAPPAGIKLAIDYVLTVPPRPAPWLQSWGLSENRIQLLFLISLAVVVISLLATVLHLWGRWYATKAVNRVQVSLRRQVFEHAVRLPLHKVYDLKSGGAASLLREDAGGAADLIFSMLYNPWRAIVQLVGSLAILVRVDWRLMVGGLFLLPIVYVTHRTWIQQIRPLWRDVRRQRQAIDGTSTETFGGMRIIRGFSRERTESSRFVRANGLLVRQQLFVWWWSRIIDVIWDTLIPMASTALLVYGGYRIIQGSMTLGDLTMFLFYLAMLLEPLATLVTSATTFQNNLAGLDRILDLLDEPKEMEARPDAVSLNRDQVAGRITFRNVTFAYPGSQQHVLRQINMDVQAGETVALVGRSGAGKTTMCNLVARFYDPGSGTVELDGRDLRKIHISSYRRLLGIVEQDVFLFDGTINENIGYGRRGATRAEIQKAAQLANADQFIMQLEKGYDTLIGERGVKLSGGQRQRLAIARALLAQPQILILDEATSNLDSESEQLIQESLKSLMQGRTCFIIAHRMSTIALADRIAVFDEGQLLAFAGHHQLMKTNQLYRRMVDLQTHRTHDAGDESSASTGIANNQFGTLRVP